MDETARGIFVANAHLGAPISCYLVLFTMRIWQNLRMEALCACSQVENSKTEKSPWTRKTKQTGPKKKEMTHFYVGKKKHLSESNKGFWYSLSCLPELSVCWFVIVLIGTFAGFTCFAVGFSFALMATLPVLVSFSSMLQQERKCVCNAMLFLGASDPLSLMPGGPVVPLVCGFTRRDNLLVWRELFMNLYELKSRIWFWEKYINFERICRVCRLDEFLWNFTKTF